MSNRGRTGRAVAKGAAGEPPLPARAAGQQAPPPAIPRSLLVLHLVADVVEQCDDAALLEGVGVHQVCQLGGQHARVAELAVAQQHPEAVMLSLRVLQALNACRRDERGNGIGTTPRNASLECEGGPQRAASLGRGGRRCRLPARAAATAAQVQERRPRRSPITCSVTGSPVTPATSLATAPCVSWAAMVELSGAAAELGGGVGGGVEVPVGRDH